MSRSHLCVSVLLGLLAVMLGFSSCGQQNAPTDPSESQNQHSIQPIPICELMPDSLAELDWLRTTYRFGTTEKKRTILHSFLQESLSRAQTSLLPSGRSGGASLSYNPLSRGPLTCWSMMCDPMPTSAAPEALSALIPEGTMLIVETTYPDGSMSVAPDSPYLSSDLGYSFTPNGREAFLTALRDTLTALISRGSLPPITCIIAYPFEDNLLEE